MPYISREDGEHFVIPSYRDVLSTQRKNQLKKDIVTLSESYGSYITMQRKSTTQVEVAFSPDTGYLLGESIWHHFKKPKDMIYCEAIPNTTEAIMVIVKNSSVYLDGSFPLDSIPEELVIFLTQQNDFEIYVYGDVPISQVPQEGKFCFEETAVKSFTTLEAPVFPTLSLVKAYQLQLVEQVLRQQGIGTFPTRQVLTGVVVIALLYMMFSYLTSEKAPPPQTAPQVNPYQAYNDKLSTPAPTDEINQFLEALRTLMTMPGWTVKSLDYSQGSINAGVISGGTKIYDLQNWAKDNNAEMTIKQKGISVLMPVPIKNRPIPKHIYPIKDVIAVFTDRLASVYPGNHISLGTYNRISVFSDIIITISVDAISPVILSLIAGQLKDMPFALNGMSFTVTNGTLTGTIIIDALGS